MRIIPPTGAAAFRSIAGAVNVHAYGAIGDGVTDDYAAIIRARNACGGTLPLWFEGGRTYCVSQQVQAKVSTVGPKWNGHGATIKAIAGTWNAGDAVILISTSCAYTRIENLQIDANGLATHGLKAIQVNAPESVFRNLLAYGATLSGGYGFYFYQCQIAEFNNIHASSNALGMRFDSCNACTANHLRSSSNVGTGVTVAASGIFSGGMVFLNPTVELNGGHGFDIDTGIQAGPIRIYSGWLESNTGDGVRLSSPNAVVRDMRISGNGTGSNYAVHIMSGGNAIIRDNFFALQSGTVGYDRVYVETGAVVNGRDIEPNYKLYGTTPVLSTPITVDDVPSLWRPTPSGYPVYGQLLHSAGGVGNYQNLLLRSRELSNASWSKGSATTVTADTVAAPDGTMTADTIDFAGTNITANRVYQNSATTGTLTGRTFVLTVWMRADTPTTVLLYIGNSSDAANVVGTCSVTTQWQQFSATKTFGVEAATALRFHFRSTAVISFYAWGVQLVEGTAPVVPTLTTDATVAAGRGLISNGLLLAQSGLAGQGGATSARPSSPVLYQEYFDTDLHYKVVWDGTVWRNGAGASV